MNIITNNRDPIIIGFPTNSRMAQDCAPIKDALELEGKEGVFRSKYLQKTVVRTARVNDIARLVGRGIYSAGVLGDDTAAEFDLEGPNGLRKVECYDSEKSLVKMRSDARVLRFEDLPETTFTLFERADDPQITRQNPGYSQRLLTTYPKLAAKCLRYFSDPQPVIPDTGRSSWFIGEKKDFSFEIDGSVDGQVESFVRNGDIPGVVGGIDLVRSGRTMQEFRLRTVAKLLESKPGLWVNTRVPAGQFEQLADTLASLQERLQSFTQG